ncbi:hypothetical protein AMTRI_Chr09g17670 [Amborella trichopoda]
MGSTEDKVYDSSSPSHPLLSPAPPPPPPLLEDNGTIDSSSNTFFTIAYNHGPRQFKDLPFLILFLLLLLSTFAFGIFCIAHHNPNFSSLSSFSYDSNTSSCVESSTGLRLFLPPAIESHAGDLKNGLSHSFTVKSQLGGLNYGFSLLRTIKPPLGFLDNGWLSLNSRILGSPLLKDLIWTLVITFFLSIPLVLGLLWVLKNYTWQIVYASLPFFILIPIFFNVFWFVACTLGDSCRESFPLFYRILVLVFIFLIIGVIAWIIYANWHRIELTIRIIGTASDALGQNMGLFVVLPSLTLFLFVYYVPVIFFLVYARLNGKIVMKEETDGYSCAWKQDSWVPWYFALAIVTAIWSTVVMVEAQVYVISGTAAQWYFAKEEGSAPHRSIRSSLRNAFGPSFGTVCFSGMIIAIVRIVRAAVDSVQSEESTGIVNLVLKYCVDFFLTAVDFLNKFTINFAAITGESYCTSSKMTYELLRRNLLSAVFVETVSTRILIGIVFVLSAIYAIVVCAILRAVSALGGGAYFVAVLAGVVLFVVLGYFVHVLDDVIDAVYVCYAIDRDKGEVCKQDVHEVYVMLPISRHERPTLAPELP